MIRPVTFVCASFFVFSGFHLYQTKHRAQEADRDIVSTMREVTRAHNHAVLLRAEYALLNDPTRLQELASQYLALRPTAPGQFVAMADLASRLPPVGPGPNEVPAEPPAPADPLIASATPAPVPAPAPAIIAEAPPVHPAPAHVAAPRPAPVVVAANPPMQALVRAVAPARPSHREAPAQLAPTPLHPSPVHARSPAYVAPAYAAPRQPVVVAQQPRAYVPPAPVRARYEPPTYSGTPFEAPRYANTPARPMGGSMLGMAYTGYQSGGGR